MESSYVLNWISISQSKMKIFSSSKIKYFIRVGVEYKEHLLLINRLWYFKIFKQALTATNIHFVMVVNLLAPSDWGSNTGAEENNNNNNNIYTMRYYKVPLLL